MHAAGKPNPTGVETKQNPSGPELSRRSLINASVGLAAASLLPAAANAGQSEQEPAALRGTISDGKITFPPLHNPTESGGPVPNPDPADKRLGVAVVGLGNLSLGEILPAFGAAKHVRVTALVSASREKASLVAAQYGVPEKNLYSYTDFDNLKNNPDVDFVYIVLPNSMHAEYTVRAAQAGKHVLCEKPMATSVAEAQQMVDACRKAGRKLMIAYRLQYDPAHRTLIEMARKKDFGELRLIDAINGQNDAPNGQWRQIKALSGGGSLPDVGIYCLNAFRYITGEEPVEVTGQITQPKNDPRFREIEDIACFTLRFPSGVFATGISGYSFHENRHLRVMATDAWFGLDPAFGYDNIAIQIGRKSGKANAEEQRRFSAHNQFAKEMDHFAECIKSNKQPYTPGEEGLQDHKIMQAIYQSAAGSSPVKLPLVTQLDTTRGPAPDSNA
jgi:predicted dehydrogenase